MIHVKIVIHFWLIWEEFVVCRAAQDERTLPISIGQLEAQSIAIVLNDIPFPRPLTRPFQNSYHAELQIPAYRICI